MKKIFYILTAILTAGMVASCSDEEIVQCNNEIESPKGEVETLYLNAGITMPETRTAMEKEEDGLYKTKWSIGDKIELVEENDLEEGQPKDGATKYMFEMKAYRCHIENENVTFTEENYPKRLEEEFSGQFQSNEPQEAPQVRNLETTRALTRSDGNGNGEEGQEEEGFIDGQLYGFFTYSGTFPESSTARYKVFHKGLKYGTTTNPQRQYVNNECEVLNYVDMESGDDRLMRADLSTNPQNTLKKKNATLNFNASDYTILKFKLAGFKYPIWGKCNVKIKGIGDNQIIMNLGYAKDEPGGWMLEGNVTDAESSYKKPIGHKFLDVPVSRVTLNEDRTVITEHPEDGNQDFDPLTLQYNKKDKVITMYYIFKDNVTFKDTVTVDLEGSYSEDHYTWVKPVSYSNPETKGKIITLDFTTGNTKSYVAIDLGTSAKIKFCTKVWANEEGEPYMLKYGATKPFITPSEDTREQCPFKDARWYYSKSEVTGNTDLYNYVYDEDNPTNSNCKAYVWTTANSTQIHDYILKDDYDAVIQSKDFPEDYALPTYRDLNGLGFGDGKNCQVVYVHDGEGKITGMRIYRNRTAHCIYIPYKEILQKPNDNDGMLPLTNRVGIMLKSVILEGGSVAVSTHNYFPYMRFKHDDNANQWIDAMELGEYFLGGATMVLPIYKGSMNTSNDFKLHDLTAPTQSQGNNQ